MIDALYAIGWLLFIVLCLRYLKVFRTTGLEKWDLSVAFLLKIIAAAIYIFIYSKIYGTANGELNYDASDFLYESKQLHDLLFTSPSTYLKIMFNWGDQEVLIQQYLSDSIHLSRGNLILVNDAKNLVKIHSIIQFFSFNNMYVHFIVFNLISLVGIRNIFLATKGYIRVSQRLFFYATVLLPSALFWGSSVLKEPLIIFGIGLLLRVFLSNDFSKRRKGIYLFFAVLMLVGFKPYILFCILLAILFYHFTQYFFKQRVLFSLFVFCLSIFLSLLIFSGPRKKLVHFVSRKQFDFENIGQGGIHTINEKNGLNYYFPKQKYSDLEIHEDYFYIKKPTTAYKFRWGYRDQIVRYHLQANDKKWRIKSQIPGSESYIHTTLIFSSFQQLILNIPEALTNALFRPFINDPGKKLKYFASFETALLFAFLLWALIKRRKLKTRELSFVVSCLVFVASLSLLIGWTTPVLGAIVRYRMPAYFVLLLVAFILIRPSRLTPTKNNPQ